MQTGYAPRDADAVPLDLPDVLALPLSSGAPYWYWIGGRPALDFVNTLRERWRRRVETLATPDDLVVWLTAAGLLDADSGARAARRTLRAATELREAIDAGVEAAVAQAPAPAAALATIDAWLAHAPRARLAPGDDGQPRLAERADGDPLHAALGMIALDAARLLGQPSERARLRICAGESCSARFYDRSRPGTRRWCSMRACGNVAKARRHRERTAPPSRPSTSEVPA